MRNYYFILCLIGLSTSSLAQRRASPQLTEEASMKAEMALIDGEKQLILENYTNALEMFHLARDINPNEGAIHFKIAEVLFKQEVYHQAVEAVEKAVTLDPKNRFYYLLAVDIHTARADLQSVQEAYEALIKLPNTKNYWTDLALIYEYQGKHNKALEMFEKAQDYFGTNEAIVQQKQEIYSRMGDPEAALTEWEQLVNEYPDNSSYIFSFAESLIDLGHLDKAKAQLERFLTSDKNNNRALLMLAEIMKRKGQLNEALNLARIPLLSPELSFNFKGGILSDFLVSTNTKNAEKLKALTQEVANVHPKEYIAQAFAGDVSYQLGDRITARVFYIKSIRISPNNYPVWQNILSIESELNMLDSLTIHAEEALEYFPNQAAIYYLGGTGYFLKKEYRLAVQLLETGKRYAVDKKLISVFNGQLGDSYNGLKQYTKSDAAYDDALLVDDTNEHVLNNYSYFLAMRKINLDKALQMSAKLIELKPNVATYLDTHGWVLFVQGKYKKAKKYLKQAVSLGESGTILEHYGDVLYKLGDQSGALKQWEKSATMNGVSKLIHQKIINKKFYE